MTLDPDGSLPLTLVKMGIYGGIWANMAGYGLKYRKKGKPGAKLAGWGGTVLFVIYRFLPQNSSYLTARRDGGMSGLTRWHHDDV